MYVLVWLEDLPYTKILPGVLYYDHILTLDVEVKHFWRLPLTRGNIMFFLNRYFSFFANIALIAYRYSLNSHTVCPASCIQLVPKSDISTSHVTDGSSYIRPPLEQRR
jgi:hypothetical protein